MAMPHTVYAANGSEVATVMVAGKVLLRDWVVLTADEDAMRAEAQMQAEAVAWRVAALSRPGQPVPWTGAQDRLDGQSRGRGRPGTRGLGAAGGDEDRETVGTP
jgi:hypothetical protein